MADIKIVGTSKRVDEFSVWELIVDGLMVCSFYGPMSAGVAGSVARDFDNGIEFSPLSVLKFLSKEKMNVRSLLDQ